ncbi:hypothetical protein Q1695_002795 [Nippostrongylus brasiliensis]|nr:hypothetical protein Q1695_002795 [Nippostrongylus brasiliensis]
MSGRFGVLVVVDAAAAEIVSLQPLERILRERSRSLQATQEKIGQMEKNEARRPARHSEDINRRIAVLEKNLTEHHE